MISRFFFFLNPYLSHMSHTDTTTSVSDQPSYRPLLRAGLNLEMFSKLNTHYKSLHSKELKLPALSP